MKPLRISDADVPARAGRIRDDVLSTAATIINGDREHQYGDARDSFERIAALWSVILDRRITADEVAKCMIAMKLSRLQETPDHRDSWVDIAGYAALGAEVAS